MGNDRLRFFIVTGVLLNLLIFIVSSWGIAQTAAVKGKTKAAATLQDKNKSSLNTKNSVNSSKIKQGAFEGPAATSKKDMVSISGHKDDGQDHEDMDRPNPQGMTTIKPAGKHERLFNKEEEEPQARPNPAVQIK